MTDRLLTPEDLADRYSVPLSSIYRWNYSGTGPRRIRVGRHVRYRPDDVAAWEQQHREGEKAS